MDSSLIFIDDIKTHSVKRLDFLDEDEAGVQQKNTLNVDVNIAVYDKGQKVVKKNGDENHKISTLHIYAENPDLHLLDEIVLGGITHVVLDVNVRNDFAFYKAVGDV